MGRKGVGGSNAGTCVLGTHWHSLTHQSGCSSPASGSLLNGYWLYSQEYCEVSVIRCLLRPLTDTSSGAVIPPPCGASGSAYRTVIALVVRGSVNSTHSPGSS